MHAGRMGWPSGPAPDMSRRLPTILERLGCGPCRSGPERDGKTSILSSLPEPLRIGLVVVLAASAVIALWSLDHLSTWAALLFLAILGIFAVAAVLLRRRTTGT